MTGNVVLPPTARPHGLSLADLAAVVVPFTLTGNDPARYPDTPFQLLYVSSVDLRPVGGGIVTTGANSFTVSTGTDYFVPIFTVNDVPPFPGVFPVTSSEAPAYLFDPACYGARDFEVVVDGRSTPIGGEYLVGPCRLEEDRSHFIHLGAFIGPLTAGTHTVAVRGGVFGRGVPEAYGTSFVEEDFTYTVEVIDPE